MSHPWQEVELVSVPISYARSFSIERSNETFVSPSTKQDHYFAMHLQGKIHQLLGIITPKQYVMKIKNQGYANTKKKEIVPQSKTIPQKHCFIKIKSHKDLSQ